LVTSFGIRFDEQIRTQSSFTVLLEDDNSLPQELTHAALSPNNTDEWCSILLSDASYGGLTLGTSEFVT
jgi:hypothetical protein